MKSSASPDSFDQDYGGSSDQQSISAIVRRSLSSAVDILDTASSRINDEIARHRREIETLELQDAELKRKRYALLSSSGLHEAENLSSPIENPVFVALSARMKERKTSVAWKVRTAAAVILRSAGRPLNRAELLAELEAMGVEVTAPKPAKAVGRIMWAADEFQHVEKGFWFMGEEPPSADKRPR